MALGGTAVEFEQSLNFYAGWRKNILPCSNKARYKQGVLYITSIFRHASVSSTYPCKSVRKSVTLSDFQSLVALSEK